MWWSTAIHLYTPRELERQLVDCGAEAVLVLENFANVLQQALPRTMIRHVITTQLGDMLGWGRGALINFFVKYVKKLAPKWSIANAITFSDALRRALRFAGGPSRLRRTTSPSFNIPAARRAFRKALC